MRSTGNPGFVPFAHGQSGGQSTYIEQRAFSAIPIDKNRTLKHCPEVESRLESFLH